MSKEPLVLENVSECRGRVFDEEARCLARRPVV